MSVYLSMASASHYYFELLYCGSNFQRPSKVNDLGWPNFGRHFVIGTFSKHLVARWRIENGDEFLSWEDTIRKKKFRTEVSRTFGNIREHSRRSCRRAVIGCFPRVGGSLGHSRTFGNMEHSGTFGKIMPAGGDWLRPAGGRHPRALTGWRLAAIVFFVDIEWLI